MQGNTHWSQKTKLHIRLTDSELFVTHQERDLGVLKDSSMKVSTDVLQQ